MSKKLTIQDATKQELIEFMFAPAGMGGGFGIPVPKDNFILWLQKKQDGLRRCRRPSCSIMQFPAE